MMYGVIDVGSNSVRLMISDGKKTLSKTVRTTRLAEGMGESRMLQPAAIERTVNAIAFFNDLARRRGVEAVYVFATAAVRLASNPEIFIDKVKKTCGLIVEVVSGDREVELGFTGALCGKDGGIVDVGGASSEIAVVSGGNCIYKKSLPLGAVTLKDECGQDITHAERVVKNKILDYGTVALADFYAIGGTATSIAAMMQGLEPYDPQKTDGYIVARAALAKLTDELYSMTVEERKKIKGLQPERAEVIAGGALILLKILDMIGIDAFTVSEKDNLEGYLMKKLEK